MENKQQRKKNYKFRGRRRDDRAKLFNDHATDVEESASVAEEASELSEKHSRLSSVPVENYFWKGRLRKVSDEEKIDIECPDYSKIPIVLDETAQGIENSEGKINIVGVRFRAMGKVYYFLPYIPDDKGRVNSKIIHTKSGDTVIVDTARGVEMGTVFVPNKLIEKEKVEALMPMRSILRLATEDDIRIGKENRETEKNAEKIFIERVSAHNLPMKLIDIQYTFDRSKLLFYFSSDGRVDFRELVKDLASIFHTRIELRQIGIRDEARIIGGLGACGRPLCCSSFLSDFVQVSIKMAKSQVMSLNPAKISGCCGRLMCCLRYENDAYEEEIALTPPVESIVKTKNGFGTVIEINPLAHTVKVRATEKTENQIAVYHRDEVEVVPESDGEYQAALERARNGAAAIEKANAEKALRMNAAKSRPMTAAPKVVAHEDMFNAEGGTPTAPETEIKAAKGGQPGEKRGSDHRKPNHHSGGKQGHKNEGGEKAHGGKGQKGAPRPQSQKQQPKAADGAKAPVGEKAVDKTADSQTKHTDPKQQGKQKHGKHHRGGRGHHGHSGGGQKPAQNTQPKA